MSEDATSEEPPPKKKRTAAERFGTKPNPFATKTGNVVGRSAELRRIAALPRRETWQDNSVALTLVFAKPPVTPGSCPPGCPCGGKGFMKLRPQQAWALTEFFEQRGGIGVMGPGAGKSLVALLISILLGWERPLLLVPAGLRDKTLKLDVPIYSRHWKLPPILGMTGNGPGALEVRSYEELSQDNFSDYLSKRKIPDGMICDEVHKLARRGAGRTKRMHRFFNDFPTTEMVGLSGTLVHRSVFDYGHITNFALKSTSPLPHSMLELRTWADALDAGIPEHVRPYPGALMDFCVKGETVRDGYRRRFLETPGVISSPDLSTNIGLIVSEVKVPKVPDEIREAFHVLRNTGDLPSGEKCQTSLDQARHARELLHGFVYFWEWPNGERDKEWLKKRKAARRYVRKMTSRSHMVGGTRIWLDTELQVYKAVEKGLIVCSEDEMSEDGKKLIRSHVDVLAEWIEIREDRRKLWNGKPEPPKKAKWISTYMLEFYEAWADQHDKNKGEDAGIAWVESIAFLEELRARDAARGIKDRCFAAGENDIEVESGKRTVFASLAHTLGKNLHQFHWMLFGNPLSSGKAKEQALARMHRPGQLADDVNAEIVLGCRETWWSWERSKLDANYIEATLGQPQRLNKATLDIKTTEAVALAMADNGDPLWAESGFSRIDGMFGVLGKDGKRAESATPVLDALKKAAKKGGDIALSDVMFDGEEEEDQEDSESEEIEEESDE